MSIISGILLIITFQVLIKQHTIFVMLHFCPGGFSLKTNASLYFENSHLYGYEL
jgi:hypothetical protein